MHDVVVVVPHWTTRLVARPHRTSSFDDAIECHAVLDDGPIVAHPPTRVGACPSQTGAGGRRLRERSPVRRPAAVSECHEADHDERYADACHARVEECMPRGAQAVPDRAPTRHELSIVVDDLCARSGMRACADLGATARQSRSLVVSGRSRLGPPAYAVPDLRLYRWV